MAISYINDNDNNTSSARKDCPPEKLRQGITQSPYMANSIQKFRFPSTGVYLYPENQSQISIHS